MTFKDNDYQNMNAVEREQIWCYFISQFGTKCLGCNKQVPELLIEWQSSNPDEVRQRPVLVVHHIDGDSSHDDAVVSGKYHPYGNVIPLCYSCNKTRKRLLVPLVAGTPVYTREKLDNIKGRPNFYNRLQIYTNDHDHICYKDMLSVGCEWGNVGSQVTIARWYDLENISDAKPKAMFQVFPYQCSLQTCNGDHVCQRGQIPKSLLELERIELTREYNNEWGDYDPQSTAWSFKEPPPLYEYIKTHGKLINHSFK